ncbi:McbB family protein [Bacillus sp. Bva_UNVM-123]|uniref:McbB family protein n=1 Tax=Bacillus sp. Bva_UNVM-123 TaxID=2829798 RepID=UPI00391F3FD8
MVQQQSLDNTTYNIHKFLFYKLSEAVVIQTSQGISKINDNRMITLLTEWELKFNKTTTYLELESIFNEDTQEAIEFLMNYKIIEEIKNKEVKINGITIISNNDSISELVYNTLLNKFEGILEVNKINTENVYCEDLNQKLLVVLLNPYNKKFAKEFVETQKDLKNSISLFGYIYSNNFYLDCLYSVDWKLPCHNCHMGHIQNSLYAGEENEVTYQHLIDTLYSETNDSFEVGTHLDAIQDLNIACLVSNKVNSFLGDLGKLNLHPQSINKCVLLDVSTLKKYEDTSIYWEMCDCYEQ